MDKHHSNTNLRERQRGQHLGTEERDSIQDFTAELNATRRKFLNYRTPEELFEKHLDKIYAIY